MRTESKVQTLVPAARRVAVNRLFALGTAVATLCAALAPHARADAMLPSSTSASLAAPAAKSAPLPVGVVARVNNVSITQDQVDQIVRTTNAPDTPALRANIKEQLIARELFRQAAEKDHYANRPDVQAAIDQAKNATLVQAYLRDQIKPAPVTDADVKAQYDKIIATLGDNEYKPSVIAVKDAATAQTVLGQLKKSVDFA